MTYIGPENLDQLNELARLEAQQADLARQIEQNDFATPEIGAAYRAAVERLGQEAGALATSHEVQVGYAVYGQEARRGLQQLAPLDGILPEEELSSLRLDLVNRIAATRDFYDRYGAQEDEAIGFLKDLTPQELALAATVEVEEVEEEVLDAGETPDPEEEVSEAAKNKEITKEVVITIGLNVVRIGKEGKAVPYTKRNLEGQRDYTEPRRRALIKLISLQPGETIKARELHAVAFGEEEQFTTNRMLELRRWFGELTFRRERMIHHTRSGQYFVNPNFDLTADFGQRFTTELALEEDQSAQEQMQTEPTTLGALWTLSSRMSEFGFVLEEAGLPTISEGIINDMSHYKPDLSHLKGNNQAIHEYRLNAMEELERLLGDSEAFLTFFDALDPNSGEYSFVELLALMDEDERRLVKRLLNARMITTEVVRGKAVAVPTRVVDAEGITIYPFPEKPIELGRGGAADKATPVAEEELSEVQADEEPVELPEPALEPTDSDPEPIVQPRPARRRRFRRKKIETTEAETVDERVQTISICISEVLDKLIGSNIDLTELHHRKTYQSGIGNVMSTSNVANARENNVGPRQKTNAMFSVEDVLRIAIYSNRKLQPYYRHHRAEIAEMIEEKIKEAIEKQRDLSA